MPKTSSTTKKGQPASIVTAGNEPSTAAEFGRIGGLKGGLARAQVLSHEERSAIAQAAAQARWSKRPEGAPPRATHTGTLRIGDREFATGVLEDGTRVLTRITFLRAIGRTGKARGGRKYDERLPVFLTAENLEPFIPPELVANSAPIPILYKGVRALGYKAELLPEVCQVFLDAKDAGVLRANQMQIAEACKQLYRGLAKIGIIALIDEATGYQNARDAEALQKLLDLYLQREFAAWAKVFPDEFYEQVFRLRKWPWRGRSFNPPQVVAHYTNDLVYLRLAPGILKELQARNPKIGKYRKGTYPQLLTADVGHPALAQHLHAVIAIMKISDSWPDLIKKMDSAFPRKGDTIQLELTLNKPELALS